mgnify:CR=1 FL=1
MGFEAVDLDMTFTSNSMEGGTISFWRNPVLLFIVVVFWTALF